MGNAYDNASLIVTPNGYKASKIYALKPTDGSSDLSFSRASTALRRNSAGLWESVAINIPRLHYPVGGGCPSWLFEPQATNIFLASRVDDNNWFSVGSTKVLNSIQSPYSGYLATKLVEDNLSSTHIILAIDSGASNATYTISFYAKTNGRNIGVLNNGLGSTLICSFDLTAGTGTGTGFLSITDAGNGWWLCVCQYNPSVSGYNIQLRLLNGTNATYLGDGVSGAYVWGTQYELGSTATSPIITAGSAVTRLKDVSIATVNLSTNNTIYYEASVNILGGYFLDFKTDSLGRQFACFVNLDGSLLIDNYNNDVNRTDNISSTGIIIANTKFKLCLVSTGTSRTLFVNGIKYNTINQTFSGGDRIYNQQTFADNLSMNNNNLLVYYQTSLSDTEAIALTT